METPTPFIVDNNFPQFFKTLNQQQSTSKFEAIDVEIPQFQPSSSTADYQFVSDVQIFEINDHNFTKSNNKASSSRSVVIDLNDDDFGGYAVDDDCVFVKNEKKNSNFKGSSKKDPICVEEFSEIARKLGKKILIDVDNVNLVQCVDDYYDDENDEIRVINVRPSSSSSNSTRKRRKKPFSSPSITEVGESSRSKLKEDDDIVTVVEPPKEIMFLCEICADTKPRKEAFKIKGCSHSYCSECMSTYVGSKLLDGVSVISCPVPGCSGVLEPEYCREILPFEVFARWGNLLCESVIMASQKFYCPFKDCSALLVDDGSEKVTISECPSCFRLFCAQCKVGWHAGIECAEYQSLNKDEREKEDIMLRKLAKSQKWQRCPKCKYYVEKSYGCLFMKCRCGIAFCYNCGSINTDHRFHNCKNCRR